MEPWEKIEHLIKNIASMIKMRDERTYFGKYSELNCNICMTKIELSELIKEYYTEEN